MTRFLSTAGLLRRSISDLPRNLIKRRLLRLAAMILAGAVISVLWVISPRAQVGRAPQLRKVAVTLGDKVVAASVAETDAARIQGLLGWETITEDQGMLLDFISEDEYAIHMQGMKFPIDSIWIDGNNEIKLVYSSIQPNSGQVYPAPVPVRYCLEVKAGLCQKYGIKAGQKVRFGPAPPSR